jgi:hypothetical protein
MSADWGLAPAAHYWWAVPAVGLFGGAVALYSIVANRRIARTRATIDFIERSESSEFYLKIRAAFRRLSTEPGFLERISMPETCLAEDMELRRQVLAYLNHYELVAIGCKHQILDEVFYSDWMKTTLLGDMKAAAVLIERIRSHPVTPIPRAYVELADMAARFEAGRETGSASRRLMQRFRAGCSSVVARLGFRGMW